MLSLINVPGGFYRLYRIIAKDFDNLNRSLLATNTLKFLFSNTFVLLYLFNSSIFILLSNAWQELSSRKFNTFNVIKANKHQKNEKTKKTIV